MKITPTAGEIRDVKDAASRFGVSINEDQAAAAAVAILTNLGGHPAQGQDFWDAAKDYFCC